MEWWKILILSLLAAGFFSFMGAVLWQWITRPPDKHPDDWG
jgi:hypothetical protein